MVFNCSNLRRCALTLLFAGALVGIAQAQSSDQIIFSKPVDDGIKSPTGDTESTPTAPTVVTPHSLTPSFFDPSSDMPRLAPPVNLNNPRSANKGSWVFMTPEQIMGVKTPEQMLGLPSKDDYSNLTPEQRFIKRQQDVKLAMATNGASSLSIWNDDSNPFSQRNNNSAFSKPGQLTGADSPNSPDGDSSKDYSRFLSAPEHSMFSVNQKFNGRGTTGAFASPLSDAPKVDLEQEAAMDRFRVLIGSSPQPAAATTAFQAPAPKPQSPVQSDIFGRPLASATTELKQPASLTTLPSVTGSYSTPTTTPKKSWWQPQPAPWLSTGLQPNSFSSGPPPRKF